MHKYYITHCDKNYIEHVEKLFTSLKKYSKHKIIFYTVDFEYDNKFDNVINIYFDSKSAITNALKTSQTCELLDTKAFYVFQKPLITKNILSKEFINTDDIFCYLDADCIAKTNCDEIFNRADQIINYPLFNEGCHPFMMVDGRGDPFANNGYDLNLTLEAPLQKLLGYDVNKRKEYLQTGVYLFNKTCDKFIDQWCSICYSNTVLKNWRLLTPYHEETVINCLLWQKNDLKHLNQVLVNIPYYDAGDDDLFKVKNMFNHLLNPPNEDTMIYMFTKIPSINKIKNLYFLHGKHSKIVYDYINEKNSII